MPELNMDRHGTCPEDPGHAGLLHNGGVYPGMTPPSPLPTHPLAGLARMPAGQPALCWPGGAVSAGALRADIERLAATVDSLRGRGPVAVIAASRRRLVTGVLAVLATGRPALVLDPLRADLHDCLAQCRPDAALVDGEVDLPASLAQAPLEATGEPSARSAPRTTVAGQGHTHDAPALLVPTSGTGGATRIVMLDAAALNAHVLASSQVLPAFGAADRWLICLPMGSIGALAALWRVYARGGTLAVLDCGFDAVAARAMMAEGASHVSVVPAMIDALVDIEAPPPRGLRCLLSGGGPLSMTQAEQALAQGWPLWQGWGMTETASHVAAGPVEDDWRPGIVGRPLPGVAVEITGEDRRLRIGGPMLMAGYATPDLRPGHGLDENGALVTGDAGEWLADGRLRILGRADGVIVTAGVNVHPEAVEARFAECPGAGDLAITAREDPRWGSVLVALYTGPAEAAGLLTWSRAHLPSAWRPREFRRVSALPRNSMGKLHRHALAALLRP